MNDELLERRLRSTLRGEAADLPFMITASEVERRLALRSHTAGGRRLVLLLAAALGIGLVGIAVVVGGLEDGPMRPTDPPPTPPPAVAFVQAEPGWQLSAGYRPEAVGPGAHSFTGPGVDGGGPVRIALTCVGEGSIEISVDLGLPKGAHIESFVAACAPEGATTGQSFEAEASYVDVSYAAPVGSWTSLSILVPDPFPTPKVTSK